MELDKNRQTLCSPTETLPIKYHDALGNLEDSVATYRCTSHELKDATERAIRSRHHEAVVETPMRAAARGYDIYLLGIQVGKAVRVGYSVEPEAVVVRGFCCHRDGTPEGDFYGVILKR